MFGEDFQQYALIMMAI